MDTNNEPKYEIGTTVEVDIDEVRDYITGAHFVNFLMNSEDSLDFPEAAFILQTLLQVIDKIREDRDNNGSC